MCTPFLVNARLPAVIDNGASTCGQLLWSGCNVVCSPPHLLGGGWGKLGTSPCAHASGPALVAPGCGGAGLAALLSLRFLSCPWELEGTCTWSREAVCLWAHLESGSRAWPRFGLCDSLFGTQAVASQVSVMGKCNPCFVARVKIGLHATKESPALCSISL